MLNRALYGAWMMVKGARQMVCGQSLNRMIQSIFWRRYHRNYQNPSLPVWFSARVRVQAMEHGMFILGIDKFMIAIYVFYCSALLFYDFGLILGFEPHWEARDWFITCLFDPITIIFLIPLGRNGLKACLKDSQDIYLAANNSVVASLTGHERLEYAHVSEKDKPA